MNRIYLYGLAEAEDQYRIVRYSYIDLTIEPVTIRRLATLASWMRFKDPSIEHVYAMDDKPGLSKIFWNTFNNSTVQNNVEFKCMLEKEGLKII